MCLSTAERVGILLSEFRARTFEELFQGVKAIPIEKYVGKFDKFPIKGFSLNSKLTSVPACQKIIKKAMVEAKVADARESKPPQEYGFELNLTKPIHMPHLENFFNAIRGKEKLNCDGEHAFEAEAAVYKVNEAVEAKKMLYFKDEDFVA